MPTRIYFVRHGTTALTEEDRFAGASEIPLSDEGWGQVVALAERLLGNADDAALVAEELAAAHRRLGEITGAFTSEDLLGEIFAHFCIGK